MLPLPISKKSLESALLPLHERIKQMESRLESQNQQHEKQLETLLDEIKATRKASAFAAESVDKGGSVDAALREISTQLAAAAAEESSRHSATEQNMQRLAQAVSALGRDGQSAVEQRYAGQIASLEAARMQGGRERDELASKRSPSVPPAATRAPWVAERISSLRARGQQNDVWSAPALALARAMEEVRDLDNSAHGDGEVALDETLFQRLDAALWDAKSPINWGETLSQWNTPHRVSMEDAETVLWAYRAEVARAWRDKRGIEPMNIVPSRTRFDVVRHESSAHLIQPCADPLLDDMVAGIERPGYVVRDGASEKVVRRALVRRYALQKNATLAAPLPTNAPLLRAPETLAPTLSPLLSPSPFSFELREETLSPTSISPLLSPGEGETQSADEVGNYRSLPKAAPTDPATGEGG